LRNGSGERALFVPKQFALQQARGDCGTIKFHKGTVLRSAAVVNRPRNDLLARPGLSRNQDRCVRVGHGLYLTEDCAQAAPAPMIESMSETVAQDE